MDSEEVQEQESVQQRAPASERDFSPVNTGIVYVLSNEAMEGYLKIGCTNGNAASDVYDRMKQLDTTGVPRAFHCEYAAVVDNYQRVEQALHVAFGDFRVRQSREFFEGIDAFRVKAVLKLLECKDVTMDVISSERNEPAEKERKPRREGFKFSMVDISPGEHLEWIDDP